ncbi:MAG: hypothetical protein JW888_03045 [Pirellulales bacterium]|nr:hypothetical protein [Pirellulales bacterium]
MKKGLLTVFGVALMVAVLVPGPTTASVIELNNYTLDFVSAAIQQAGNGINDASDAAAAGIVRLPGVDEWNFNDKSFVGFVDSDGSGNISAGDLFYDFGVANVTGFDTVGGSVLKPDTYGNSLGGAGQTASTHELTIAFRATGVQVSNAFFVIQSLDQLDAYVDAGVGFTPSDISAAGSYVDGLLVEDARDLISGSGNNTVPSEPAGELAMRFTMQDYLTGEDNDFEEDFLADDGSPLSVDVNVVEATTPDPVPNWQLVIGVTDTTNVLTNSGALTVAQQLGGVFGFNPGIQVDPINNPAMFVGGSYGGVAFDFGFVFDSEGSLNKEIVPEPWTALIWGGLGLFGLALARYRRK